MGRRGKMGRKQGGGKDKQTWGEVVCRMGCLCGCGKGKVGCMNGGGANVGRRAMTKKMIGEETVSLQ